MTIKDKVFECLLGVLIFVTGIKWYTKSLSIRGGVRLDNMDFFL